MSQPFTDLPFGKKQRLALVQVKPKGRHQFLVKKRTWTKLFCDRTRGCSELMRPHLQIGNGSQHQQTIWPTPLTQKYMNHRGCSGKNERGFQRKLLVLSFKLNIPNKVTGACEFPKEKLFFHFFKGFPYGHECMLHTRYLLRRAKRNIVELETYQAMPWFS